MNFPFPRRMAFLKQTPKRFKIAFGGRGGMKTTSFAQVLVAEGLERSIRVLCAREYMKNIRQSVHESLKKQIRAMKLDEYYDVGNTYIRSKINETEFFYDGLTGGATGIKSYEDIDICWIEEAENVSEKSLDNVIRTIRKDGSELWFSYNPDDEFGAVHSEFVKPYINELREKRFYENEKHCIAWVNLEDNPFAPQELIDDSEKLKKANPRKWMWVYGGECYSDYEDSIIMPEWVDAAVDAHIKLGWKPLGEKVCGFDLADTGDHKAIVNRHGSLVKHAEQWTEGELPEALDRGFSLAWDWQARSMVYDAAGLGASMKVHLDKTANEKECRTYAYFDAGAVRNPEDDYIDGKTNADMFRNARAQDFWGLADRLEATYNAVKKGIYVDPDRLISLSSEITALDVLKSQLIKIKRDRRDTTRRKIQSKKDALKEGIKSPNLADALKMCFANPEIADINKPPAIRINFDSHFAA